MNVRIFSSPRTLPAARTECSRHGLALVNGLVEDLIAYAIFGISLSHTRPVSSKLSLNTFTGSSTHRRFGLRRFQGAMGASEVKAHLLLIASVCRAFPFEQ